MMQDAIVCGGGVAGLSAAIALRMKGWHVDLYERDAAIRGLGAGIFIKANGLRALASFGLLEKIRGDCVVLQEARTLDKTGNVLQRRTLHALSPVWNIQRQALVGSLLQRAIELGAHVHTDRALESVDADGSVAIGGRQLRAGLVVAADGVNSIARHALGLDRPVRAPLSGATRLLIPRGVHEADDIVRESWSGRLRVGISPCTRSEAFIYFIAPVEDQRGTRVPIDAGYWSQHFPRLASEGVFERAAVAGGAHHRYPFVGTTAWSKGCVALVGDAAHAQPPTLGQGAGLSLTNTLLLSHYVSSTGNLSDALAAWETEWRWISDRTQVWARRYDWITSEWPRSALPVRDAVIWMLGKSKTFNGHIRIADRIDAERRCVLPTGAAVELPRQSLD